MIQYAWLTSLDADQRREVAEVLTEADADDAVGGFPPITIMGAHEQARHLLVHLLPDERADSDIPAELTLAAYLRLEPQPDGAHFARYVVRPRMRSRGITTLLVERMGLDVRAPGGWVGTGAVHVSVWATGDHPAAQRLTRRFRRAGVRATRTDWQLMAPLRPSLVPPHALHPVLPQEREKLAVRLQKQQSDASPSPAMEVLATEDGVMMVDAGSTEETDYGTAGRIWALDARSPEQLEPLLEVGMAWLLKAGLRVAAITVNSADQDLVRCCRLKGFTHYRTDTEYTLA